jgi:hypothetical protein
MASALKMVLLLLLAVAGMMAVSPLRAAETSPPPGLGSEAEAASAERQRPAAQPLRADRIAQAPMEAHGEVPHMTAHSHFQSLKMGRLHRPQKQSLLTPSIIDLGMSHSPNHPRGWKEALNLLLFFWLVLVISTMAGLIFLVMALFIGPPFWALAIGFLIPLAIMVVLYVIWLILDIVYWAQSKKARKAKAS